jgi:hypothetical protein
MAIVRAVKTGVWSDPAVWNTGALPTSADIVYSNTFTVTIDISPTVLSISNGSNTGVSLNGTFVINANNITLTGDVVAAAQTCLTVSIASGNTANIVGNVSGGYQNTPAAVVFSGQGTLNITGNCAGGGGTSNSAYGVNNTSTGTVNITGNVSGGSNSNIALSHGVNNNSTGSVNITGTVTGGSAPFGFNNASTGNASLVGTLQAGTVAAVGGSTTGSVILTGPFLTTGTGINPVTIGRWFWANSNVTPTYYQIRTANLATIRPLYTADSVGGNPAVGNVRSGTVYGPSSELTGTCAVPGAASVAFGVAVDNTTGTAVLTAANVRSAVGLASANLDTQLDALPTAAENATAVWSEATRTITGGTVDTLTNAPSVPSAATIASQVRTELTPELARVSNTATTQEVADIVEGAFTET